MCFVRSHCRRSRDLSSEVVDRSSFVASALHQEIEALFNIAVGALVSMFFLSPSDGCVRIRIELLGDFLVRER